MELIQASPEALLERAAELRALRDRHDAAAAETRALAIDLNGVWTGAAQAEFAARIEGMHGLMTAYSQMLGEYAALLEESARAMRETDDSVREALERMG